MKATRTVKQELDEAIIFISTALSILELEFSKIDKLEKRVGIQIASRHQQSAISSVNILSVIEYMDAAIWRIKALKKDDIDMCTTLINLSEFKKIKKIKDELGSLA